MSQKPFAMDHLLQIIQLKRDGVAIREIVRRTGVSRNSVRKYLSKFGDADVPLTNKELADTAYNNEQLEQDAQRLQNLFSYFKANASDLSMHMEYKPGDMIMIDFAGKKQYYVDESTGERISCEVFVSILPFSGLIFCLAVHTQQTADLTTCFNEMLRF